MSIKTASKLKAVILCHKLAISSMETGLWLRHRSHSMWLTNEPGFSEDRPVNSSRLIQVKTPRQAQGFYLAGSTGFEPAISSVTGRHVRPLHHEPSSEAYSGCRYSCTFSLHNLLPLRLANSYAWFTRRYLISNWIILAVRACPGNKPS
jgi:hypothetical protein